MAFYNSKTTERLADTIQAMRLILPRDLAQERTLAEAKWFAYRFMSPLEATKHFAEIYRKGVKAFVRTHRDAEEAERVNGMALNIFDQPSGSLTQLWRARQKADELGLPYDLLVDFGFHFVSRRRWRSTPRPIQLFSSENSEIAWPLEIEKYLEAHLPMAINRLPLLPQFRTENYRKLPAQDAFRQYVLAELNEYAGNWATKIGNVAIRDRHLPIQRAISAAPRSQRQAIVATLRDDIANGMLASEPAVPIASIALAPACMGISAIPKDAGSGCSACAFNSACTVLASKAVEHMRACYGSAHPLAEARRLAKNARERAFRMSKKAKKLGLAGAT